MVRAQGLSAEPEVYLAPVKRGKGEGVDEVEEGFGPSSNAYADVPQLTRQSVHAFQVVAL